jgi:outer membrane protein TolC
MRLGIIVGLFSLYDLSYADQAGLTVEEAIRLALVRNERAQIAERRVTAAAARVDRARAFFFPDLTASGTYVVRGFEARGGRIVTEVDADDLSAAVALDLALFDARAFPLYRQARLERRAAELGAADEKRLLAFEAADAFLRTLGVEQVQASAERRLAFARQTVEDTTTRFEAKLVSVNDVTRAQLELATAEREATIAQGETQRFREQLGHLIDTRIEGPLVIPEHLLSPPDPGDPNRLVIEAQARRPDIAAGRARADALEAFAEEPGRRLIPILGLTSQFEETFEAGPNERDWFVGLNLTWPLYDGGERRADRNERQALAKIADLEVLSAQRQVERDVRQALIAIESDRAATRQATVAVEVGRKNAEEVTTLYRQGLAGALTVADANIRLFEAEVALARARYGLGLSLLNLRTALGLNPLGHEER